MNKKTWISVITSILGNTLEWYDFALYGYFASVISKNFFPLENEFISLILTFSVFTTGFIVRPIGGAIFGHIGDRYGRRVALIASIALITIPTTLMGILPSYQTAGIISPLLLVLMRLLQGIAVSGELTGAGAFLVESASENKRGFYGSLTMCSTYLGLLIGSGLGILVTLFFTDEEIMRFAWRIPFVLSFLFGIMAFILRLKCEESPLFLKIFSTEKILRSPVKTTFSEYLPQMVTVFLLSSVLAVAIYMLIGYFPTFFTSVLKMSLHESMTISFVGLLALTILVPVMGYLSDKTSKKFIFGIGAVSFILFSYSLFDIANKGGYIMAVYSELLLVLCLAPIAGTLISIMSEIFPTNVRYTGISIGYNLSMTIFGGTTPLISIYLTKLFNTQMAPTYYLIFCGILTLFSLCGVKKFSLSSIL